MSAMIAMVKTTATISTTIISQAGTAGHPWRGRYGQNIGDDCADRL